MRAVMRALMRAVTCPCIALVTIALVATALLGCGTDAAVGAAESGPVGLSHDAVVSDGAGTTGGDASKGSSSDSAADTGTVDTGGWSTWPSEAGSRNVKDAYIPRETEKIAPFGAPEGSANFVYIPVSGADTIVKVSGKTLKVSLVEVGNKPSVIRAIVGQDAVAVLNRGSDDVSVLRSTESSDKVTFSAILPHCNRLSMSPTGHHAVAWYDHGLKQANDPTGSFQSVSIVTLTEGGQKSVAVSIGFRPRAVQFDASGTKAFVITNDGISIITLAAATDGTIAVPVPISKQKTNNPAAIEVHVTPSGNWSVARLPGSVTLTAVHLPSKTMVEITLPSEPTDIDLAPDGSGALLVLPATKNVAWVELPSAATKTLATKIATIHWLTAGLAKITDDGKSALYIYVGARHRAGRDAGSCDRYGQTGHAAQDGRLCLSAEELAQGDPGP